MWRDAWLQAARYVGQALLCIRAAPRLYLLITFVYVIPALVAGTLAILVSEPVLWEQILTLALPWITVVLGTVVIMVAVAYQARGHIVNLVRATRIAIRWIPRYVWTNAHTSVIFWAPVGMLLAMRQWLAATMGGSAAYDYVLAPLWWLAIGSVAVYLHTRTLLAPFLAVHADLPASLAALEAWRLAGRHFPLCFATLVLGTLPVGLPLAIAAVALGPSLSRATQEALLVALPDLAWAAIQLARPVLINAVYRLYRDLWHDEQARRTTEGAPHTPAVARASLALTRALPKYGSWD